MAQVVGTSAGTVTSNTATHSFSLMVEDAPNSVVLVGVHFGDADATVVSVSVGGVPGSRVVRANPFATSHASELWVVVNPPAGSQTVVVSLSAAAESAATAQQLRDVDQTNPVRDSAGMQGSNNSPSQIGAVVDSEVGDAVMAIMSMNGQSIPTPDIGLNTIRATNASDVAVAAWKAGEAASTTMLWTVTSGAIVQWSIAAASFRSPETAITTLTADPGNIAVDGAGAGLRATRAVTATPGGVMFEGTPAVLRATRRVAAGSGSVELVGSEATLTYSRVLTLIAETGAIPIAGTQAALRATRRVVAESGAIGIAGITADLIHVQGFRLSADPGTFAMSGSPAAPRVSRRMLAEMGSLAVAGSPATLTYSAAPAQEIHLSLAFTRGVDLALGFTRDIRETLRFTRHINITLEI